MTRRITRLCHHLLHVVLTLGVVAATAAALLAWRLSQGPIDVAWLARQAEAAYNTPDQPGQLSIGTATIAWTGFADGPKRELELRLQTVLLRGPGRDPLASLDGFELNLAASRLLLGQIVPRDVAATGLVLHVTRGVDGVLALEGEPPSEAPTANAGTSLSDSLGELARPPARDPTAALRGLQHLEQLRRVHVSGATLLLHDAALGADARLSIGTLDLRRQRQGGIRGTADGQLTLGAAQATLALQAELGDDGGTTLHLAIAPIAAASVQQAAAEQGAIDRAPDVLEAAIQASATLVLDRELRPTAASLHTEAASGRLHAAGATIGFDSLLVDAEASWTRPGWTMPGQLTLPRARAVLRAPRGAWPTTLAAQGQADLTGPRIRATLALTLDHLAFADLPALWPERLGGHTRPWLTENLTAGTARDGAVHLALEAAPGLTGVTLTAIDASLVGDDVTINWLRPVPPIEHAQARLAMTGPQILDVAITSARQGAMQLANGTVHITGLADKDQFLTLGADIQGGVADLVTLLRQPRLHLLDRHPVVIRNPGGAMAGHLGIDLPLKHELQFEDVKIAAQARLTELRLGGIAAGRDIDRGDVQIDATQDALHLVGKASVATIPAEITVDMDFRGGPATQIVQRVLARGRATPAQLTTAGLDPGGVIASGAGLFTVRYAQRRDTSAELQVGADLAAAGLALAGWRKAAGPAAEAGATLLLRQDRLVGVEHLQARGPGLEIAGRAEYGDGRSILLQLDHIALGPTQAHGQIRFPSGAEPIHAVLAGSLLDLSTQFDSRPTGGPATSGKATPWTADLRFDRVVLAHGRALAGVAAHAENDGKRIQALTLTTAGPERVQASIVRAAPGRRVTVRADDGGTLLQALDVLETVQGGQLAVDAQFDDTQASSPLTGTVGLSGFHVRNLATLGKLLQAVTVYGVVDAVNGSGLAFSQLSLPFRWDGGVLELRDAQAFSASLGLTARGRVDTKRGTVDLQGTIVPAYALNSALGRIPVLGRLFSAEKGGGLVAVNYTMRGALANPSVVVNPLSALTPGFLRGLFHLLD